MFPFLFKYPIPVFSKGQFVLLGTWPGWVLLLLIVACMAALALLIWSRLPQAAQNIGRWRAGAVWLLQSLLIATVLVLLWQPAITVAELAPQQNVIAVVLDDSRSMAIADSGSDGKQPREAAAEKALEDGVLAGLQKKFQVRLYRLDSRVARAAALHGDTARSPCDPHQRQPATAGNRDLRFARRRGRAAQRWFRKLRRGSGDLSLETINALRNRRIPVHTVGFGKEQAAHDVELNDVRVAFRAMANSRIPATVTFHQRGYAGSQALLVVRDGDKTVGSRRGNARGRRHDPGRNRLF